MKYLKLTVAGIIVGMTISQTAFAYLDPGTGSMIIQGLIAGVVMVSMAIKMYWRKIVGFLRSLFHKSNHHPSESDEI